MGNTGKHSCVLIPYQQDGPLGQWQLRQRVIPSVLIPYQQDGPLGRKRSSKLKSSVSLNPLSAGWSVRTQEEVRSLAAERVLIPYQQDGPLGLYRLFFLL